MSKNRTHTDRAVTAESAWTSAIEGMRTLVGREGWGRTDNDVYQLVVARLYTEKKYQHAQHLKNTADAASREMRRLRNEAIELDDIINDLATDDGLDPDTVRRDVEGLAENLRDERGEVWRGNVVSGALAMEIRTTWYRYRRKHVTTR